MASDQERHSAQCSLEGELQRQHATEFQYPSAQLKEYGIKETKCYEQILHHQLALNMPPMLQFHYAIEHYPEEVASQQFRHLVFLTLPSPNTSKYCVAGFVVWVLGRIVEFYRVGSRFFLSNAAVADDRWLLCPNIRYKELPESSPSAFFAMTPTAITAMLDPRTNRGVRLVFDPVLGFRIQCGILTETTVNPSSRGALDAHVIRACVLACN